MTTSTYQVVITNSSLGQAVGNPPYDGFINPTPLQGYLANLLLTGTTYGTVAAGQVVFINNYPVTMSGTTATTAASDINATSDKHHAIAGVSSSKLTLINDPLYWMEPVSVSDGEGTPGITAQMGFLAPTSTPITIPTSLTYTMALARGNWRWKGLLEQLSLTGSINAITSVVVSGVNLTFASNTTSIQFNVTFDNDQYYSYDFAGDVIYGTRAVAYNVARGLMYSNTVVDVVFNGTNTIPTPPPTIVSGPDSQTIVIGALTTSSSTALSNVTVTAV